jgi:hypothetical protein
MIDFLDRKLVAANRHPKMPLLNQNQIINCFNRRCHLIFNYFNFNDVSTSKHMPVSWPPPPPGPLKGKFHKTVKSKSKIIVYILNSQGARAASAVIPVLAARADQL